MREVSREVGGALYSVAQVVTGSSQREVAHAFRFPESLDSMTAKQVAGFIAKFDPAVAKLARAARAKLRKRLPTAIELVYDNYNALALGFGPTERTSEAVFSIAVFARGVNLYFIRGASIPDPDGVLQGEGKQGRFIRLSSASQMDDPVVARVMATAIAHAAVPFAKTGKGYTIVKSISAKQRPRRPPRDPSLRSG
jgi:hypothetical protein